MGLIKTENNYPTMSMSEIDELIDRTPFTILPTAGHLISFIDLNFESIIKSMDITEKSKESYLSNGKEFLFYLQKNGISITIYSDFKAYLLRRTDKSDNWQMNKLIVAKAILKHLHGVRRILTIDLTNGVKSIIASQRHKDGLNDSEINKVRDYINEITDPNKQARLNLMFSLLTFQGLRQFEMCSIKIEDVNFYGKTIFIKGKGGKSEDITMHPKTLEAIKTYMEVTGKKSGYLFTSEKGTTKDEKLSERGFRKIFDSIFDSLGIERTAHGFRHFFVTKMLEATNGNIGIVKQFSRHSAIQTVSRYDDRRLRKQHFETYYETFANI